MYIPESDALLDETMDEGSFSGFFESFDFGEEIQGDTDKLYLNGSNRFIKSLRQVEDRQLAAALAKSACE